MTTFKAPKNYVVKVGNEVIKFNVFGEYSTDDSNIIDALSKVPHIEKVSNTKKETKKEAKKVEKVEEVIEETVEEETEDEEIEVIEDIETLRETFELKFGKKVPNNKKNDSNWIINKLAE